jgi:putative ABC transport system ATP-binding protein
MLQSYESEQSQLIQTSEPASIAQNLNHYFGEESLRKQVLFETNLVIQPGEVVIMTARLDLEKQRC